MRSSNLSCTLIVLRKNICNRPSAFIYLFIYLLFRILSRCQIGQVISVSLLGETKVFEVHLIAQRHVGDDDDCHRRKSNSEMFDEMIDALLMLYGIPGYH